MATAMCMKQTSSICMYINVIYLFVMHEICVRTVFEPFGEKTPSLLFMLRKESFPYATVDEGWPRIIHMSVEGTCCAIAHSLVSRQIFLKEQFPFFSTAFC
jgi:hypothetical protein